MRWVWVLSWSCHRLNFCRTLRLNLINIRNIDICPSWLFSIVIVQAFFILRIPVQERGCCQYPIPQALFYSPGRSNGRLSTSQIVPGRESSPIWNYRLTTLVWHNDGTATVRCCKFDRIMRDCRSLSVVHSQEILLSKFFEPCHWIKWISNNRRGGEVLPVRGPWARLQSVTHAQLTWGLYRTYL